MSSKPTNIKVEEKSVRTVEDTVTVAPVVEASASVNADLLKRLQNKGDVEIIGLDMNTVMQHIMNTRTDIRQTMDGYNALIADGTLSDTIRGAAQRSMENARKTYENELTPVIEENIANIKICYKEIKDGVEALKELITTMVSNIVLPKCLGAVTPNPATTLAEAKVFRQQIRSECGRLTTTAVEMVRSADKIYFKIPSTVETVLLSISSVEKMLDKLPV